MGERARVVVVCDQPIYGAGLAETLSEDERIDVAGAPVPIVNAWATIAHTEPDVVVWVAEGGDDVDPVVVALGVPVVVVGTGEPVAIGRAARGGAAGYVRSNDCGVTMREVVATVAGGQAVYPQEWRDAAPAAEDVHLTPRERDILALVVECHSNKQIARTLGIAEQTVKNQLGHLMLKVGVSSRLQLYKWAVDRGLVGPSSLPRDVGAPGVDAVAG